MPDGASLYQASCLLCTTLETPEKKEISISHCGISMYILHCSVMSKPACQPLLSYAPIMSLAGGNDWAACGCRGGGTREARAEK
jgi:hypothetical protein